MALPMCPDLERSLFCFRATGWHATIATIEARFVDFLRDGCDLQSRLVDVQQVFALTASYVGARQLRIRQLVLCVLDLFVRQLVLCVLDSFFGYR